MTINELEKKYIWIKAITQNVQRAIKNGCYETLMNEIYEIRGFIYALDDTKTISWNEFYKLSDDLDKKIKIWKRECLKNQL